MPDTQKSKLDLWLARKKKKAVVLDIPKMPKDTPAPLSRGQQRLWLLQQLYPDNPFYQYAHAYRFKGNLNIKALLSSFQMVAQRHAVLRTNFSETENGTVQVVHAKANIPTEVIDLQHLTVQKQTVEIENITKRKVAQTFDLEKDSLLRVTVLILSEKDFYVLLSMHHIVGDRWSLQVLNKELATSYRELSKGENSKISPLKIQYTDYAYWQKSQLEKPADLDYWKQHLGGELPVLAMPTDFSRPITPTFQGLSTTKNFSSKLSDALKNLAKEQNTTPFVLLLAAYQILLHRYTGQDDLVIGTPFTNRDKLSLEKLIGFFNETLVLRADLSNNPTFTEFLAQVKATTTNAFNHKNTSFETLVKTINPKRNGTTNPLFQVMFLYNSIQKTPTFSADLMVEETVVDLAVSKFDLTLFVTDKGENLSATFEYATDLFADETIERLHGHLEVLLQSIVENPRQEISKINLLSKKENIEIVKNWNETNLEISDKTNVLQLFEKHARLTPDATCVSTENGELSYQEVNEKAIVIAKGLQAKGVNNGMFVGLHVKRSTDLIVGIIAVLKAGGAYLPLDPEYPKERIDYMLQDAAVKVVLTQEDIKDNLSQNEVEVLSFDEAINLGNNTKILLQTIDNQQFAYIIYTSGSTGKPKGVPITHENLLYSTSARFHFYTQQPKAFLLLSSFAFDSSVAGIFWTLTQGGNLIIPRKRIEQDINGLSDLIAQKKVTHSLMLPSLYDLLLKHSSPKKLQSLNTIMVAGEACTAAVVAQHFLTLPQAKLYNEYGPTEGTVWCTAHEIKSSDSSGMIPIGKPIPNVQNYILDNEKQPVPIGVAGELYIGGKGLSKGYLNRPDLTKEKFVNVELLEGEITRLYRTGDLASYRVDGVIEFLGRVDRQVKIRGYRIEPDEIKSILQQQKGVKEAVISVHIDGSQKRLIAYLTRENDLSINDLKANLKTLLPDYMIPSLFVSLEEFPRLPNGKIDKINLPLPSENTIAKQEDFVAPQTKVEEKLAAIWEDVLKVKPIGRADNFFDIGGDSILSIQIIAKARKAGFTLAANQLFENQTIAELANSIQNTTKNKSNSLTINDLKTLEIAQHPLSFMQRAFLMHHLQEEKDQGFLQLEFVLGGDIDIQNWTAAWKRTAERHAVLRTQIKWKDLAQPVQNIQEETELKWQIIDWTDLNPSIQLEKLNAFRTADKGEKLDLSQPSISRLSLIRLSEKQSIFFWTCHHILVDGWSGGLVLKDALHFYQAEQKNSPLVLSPIPSYSTFLDWQEKNDTAKTANFWADYFTNFDTPTLFNSNQKTSKKSDFENYSFSISKSTTEALNVYARQSRITLNTLLKGLWGVLLQQYFGKDEVTFGTTVSGRNADFPMLDQMSGLFMNVLPTRVKANKNETLVSWLQEFQQEQSILNTFDQTTLDQVSEYADLPKHTPLFDSLFVFGNFLKDGMNVGDISVQDFKGGFTSIYPLTIRVNPISALQFDLRYDKNVLSDEKIEWIYSQFLLLLQGFEKENYSSYEDIIGQISKPSFTSGIENISNISSTLLEIKNSTYTAPRNETELQLTIIWEELFGHSPIGVTENFFDLGGKSLLAMQLFSKIENDLGTVLPPMTLMQNSTIEALAQQVSGEATTAAWDTIVPLRASGSKTPLFCIHAGGAHVFFYEGLAKYMSAEQPIYAIQPQGLDGEKAYHGTIEEMATHYISEVRGIQADGHYRLLGTCFSNAVCLEMAKQLDAMGCSVSMYIVDSAPAHLIPLEKSKPLRRFLRILLEQNWSLLYRKLRRRVLIYKKKASVKPMSAAERQLQNTINSLNSLYAAYTWTPFNGKITLIRSTQFAEKEGKRFHLKQWDSLAKGGLEVHVVEGRHLTIFEEPAVKGLAEELEKCLDKKQG